MVRYKARNIESHRERNRDSETGRQRLREKRRDKKGGNSEGLSLRKDSTAGTAGGQRACGHLTAPALFWERRW